MQGPQSLAWADNAIKLAVDMTVAAINRVNLQGTAEQQAAQIRAVMAPVFPEAVTLVREAPPGPRPDRLRRRAFGCSLLRGARRAPGRDHLLEGAEAEDQHDRGEARAPNVNAAIAICWPTE